VKATGLLFGSLIKPGLDEALPSFVEMDISKPTVQVVARTKDGIAQGASDGRKYGEAMAY